MVNNSENKENAYHLDPSKAWIKNIGPGSARKFPKNRFSRNKDRTELANAWQKTQAPVNETKRIDNTKTPQPDGAVIDLTNSLSKENSSKSVVVEETILEDSQASVFSDTLVDERTIQSSTVNDTVVDTLMISGIVPLNDTTLKDCDQNRVKDKTIIDSRKPVKSSETYTCVEISSDVSSEIFDKTDTEAAESTVMPNNSTITSTTCIQMEMAANNLRKMHVSNGKFRRF